MIDFISWCQKQKLTGYGTRQFKLPNDETYSVIFCEAQKHSVPRPNNSVLFLHGTGNDAWFPQAYLIDRMTAAGLNFFSIQLPGHGQYDSSVLEFERLGSFVLNAVQQIRQEFGINKFILAGQSLGAVAIAQTITKTQSIQGLLGAALITMPLNPQVGLRSAIPELLLPFFKGFWRLTKYFGIVDSVPAFGPFRRREFPVRLPPKSQHTSYIHHICTEISRVDWASQLQQAKLPLLAVYAQLDLIAPASEAEHLKRVIPRINIEVINSENHFSIMGSEQLCTAIIQWLNRIENNDV